MAVRPGDLNFLHVQAFVDDVMTVEEDELTAAMRWLAHVARIMVEPSGAAAVAGALQTGDALRESGGRPVVAVLSGGNIAPDAFARAVGA
jgi:threonine dehydratase